MASYFWVGGAGTLDNTATTHIAATSGGAAGAGPITAADSITVDANSGFTSSSTALTVAAGFSCAAFTLTGPSNKLMAVTQNGAMTVTGAFSVNGATTINRVGWSSATPGTAVTLTVGSVTSASNVDFTDITVSGATLAGSSIGDGGGNTNVTPTAARTVYAVGSGTLNFSSTTMWATTSGGASGAAVPLPQDSVVLDANSTGTYTCDMPRPCKHLTCTGTTGTLKFGTSPTIYGSITLAAGMTWTAAATITLAGRTSGLTLTSAGQAWKIITLAAPGGIYTLQDAYSGTTINHTGLGTLSDAGHPVTLTGAYNNNTAGVANTLTASGIWTLSGTGTVWSVTNTATTLNVTGMTVVVSDVSATAKTWQHTSTIHMDGATLQVIGGGTGVFKFLTGMPAGTLTKVTIGAPKTVQLWATATLTAQNWALVGTSGNLITLQSTTAGTQATISTPPTVGGVSMSWVSLQDIHGGQATWWASNATNVSNNTGITFSAPARSWGATQAQSPVLSARKVTKIKAAAQTTTAAPPAVSLAPVLVAAQSQAASQSRASSTTPHVLTAAGPHPQAQMLRTIQCLRVVGTGSQLWNPAQAWDPGLAWAGGINPGVLWEPAQAWSPVFLWPAYALPAGGGQQTRPARTMSLPQARTVTEAVAPAAHARVLRLPLAVTTTTTVFPVTVTAQPVQTAPQATQIIPVPLSLQRAQTGAQRSIANTATQGKGQASMVAVQLSTPSIGQLLGHRHTAPQQQAGIIVRHPDRAWPAAQAQAPHASVLLSPVRLALQIVAPVQAWAVFDAPSSPAGIVRRVGAGRVLTTPGGAVAKPLRLRTV